MLRAERFKCVEGEKEKGTIESGSAEEERTRKHFRSRVQRVWAVGYGMRFETSFNAQTPSANAKREINASFPIKPKENK